MAKIKVRQTETAEETFARFLPVKRAEGIAEKTVASYSGHFHAISKHLDTTRDIRSISNSEPERMIVSMQDHIFFHTAAEEDAMRPTVISQTANRIIFLTIFTKSCIG